MDQSVRWLYTHGDTGRPGATEGLCVTSRSVVRRRATGRVACVRPVCALGYTRLHICSCGARMAEPHSKYSLHVRFEVFAAVTMKNVVFWNVTPVALVKADVSE
jgi:hypothetical protein